MQAPYKPIPVEEAKRIAETFDKSQVVILAFDPVHQVTQTTTYGKEAFDKENAAATGVICTNAVGCDLSKAHTFEDFHDDYSPALFKETLELLQKLLARNDFATPYACQRVEKILKAAGKHPRFA